MYVFTVYLFAFFSREVVVTYHVSQLLSHLHTYSQCFNLRIYISQTYKHHKYQFAKGSSLYYSYFSQVSIYKNSLTVKCCTFLFTFSQNIKESQNIEKRELSHEYTVIQYSNALCRSRDHFHHFSSVGMQDSQSAQTPDKTNKQLQTFLKRQLSQGHTVLQYSSAVHHAKAGAISATFHQWV